MAHKIWFVLENSRQRGPFSQTELENLHKAQELNHQTLVWREGQKAWRPLEQVIFPPPGERPRRKTKKRGRFGLVLALGPVLVFVALFFGQKKSPFAELPPSIRNRLESILEIPYGKRKQRFGWAIAPSGAGLYMATNHLQQANIFLTMVSVDGRIFGQGKVVAHGQSLLRGGAAYFQQFRLSEGQLLFPGEYKITLLGLDPHSGGEIFSHRGKILFYRGGRRDFAHQLKKFRAAVAEVREEHLSLQDRIQRYKSFLSLVDRLQALYLSAHQRSFEQNYHQSIGPYLWGLISDNDQLHLNWINANPERSQHYEELTDFGKDIGDLAVSMLDSLEASGPVSRSGKDLLARTRELKELGNDSIAALSEQLGRLN